MIYSKHGPTLYITIFWNNARQIPFLGFSLAYHCWRCIYPDFSRRSYSKDVREHNRYCDPFEQHRSLKRKKTQSVVQKESGSLPPRLVRHSLQSSNGNQSDDNCPTEDWISNGRRFDARRNQNTHANEQHCTRNTNTEPYPIYQSYIHNSGNHYNNTTQNI